MCCRPYMARLSPTGDAKSLVDIQKEEAARAAAQSAAQPPPPPPAAPQLAGWARATAAPMPSAGETQGAAQLGMCSASVGCQLMLPVAQAKTHCCRLSTHIGRPRPLSGSDLCDTTASLAKSWVLQLRLRGALAAACCTWQLAHKVDLPPVPGCRSSRDSGGAGEEGWSQ